MGGGGDDAADQQQEQYNEQQKELRQKNAEFEIKKILALKRSDPSVVSDPTQPTNILTGQAKTLGPE